MVCAEVVTTSSSMPTILLPPAMITKILRKPTCVENEGPVTSTRTKLVTITNDGTTTPVEGAATTPPPPPLPQVHMKTKTTDTMVFQTTATMYTPNYVEESKQARDRSSIITTNDNNSHLLVHREPEESSKKNKDTLTVTNMKTTFVTISYSSHDDASLDPTTTTTTTDATSPSTAASSDPHSGATDGGVPTWTADETTPTEKPSGGTIFCPFEERPDIYTLCVLGQTGVVPPTATARTKTSAAYGVMARNPLARLRVAVVSSSLWDPIRALAAATAAAAEAGGDVHGYVGERRMNLRWGSRCPVAAATTIVAGFEEEEQETFTFEEDGKGKGEEDAAEAQIAHLKKNLDAARDLIRAQQQLLDGQHAIIAEYKESLAQAVKLLAEAIVGGS